MNYRNENSTPRDRNEGYEFLKSTNEVTNRTYPERSCNCHAHVRGNINVCPIHSRIPEGRCHEFPRKLGCGHDNGYLKPNAPIAMVYSPVQVWRELYDPCTALTMGTIFKELDLPFYPTPCRRKENSQCQCR